jgi:ABC-type transport system involved in multi-copper enzyme maturation permease subunit
LYAGPIFHREAITLPRQFRHYLIRSGYIGLFLVLMYTAGQATFGFQSVRGIHAVAGFGQLAFLMLGFVQLTLVMFFSLLLTAGSIAQEKDRQTLILLLMTDLSNREIVLGKLLASLLQVSTLIVISVPVFLLLQLLGGVDSSQILWLFAVCAVTALLTGSWAAFVAFRREKTFQILATCVLGIVFYLGVLEALIALTPAGGIVAEMAATLSPYRALWQIMTPLADESVATAGSVAALNPVIALSLLSCVLIGVSIRKLRIWNPSRALFIQPETTDEDDEAGQSRRVVRHRSIWSNPVIWREIMTRAYGRRVVFIKLAYFAIAAAVFTQALTTGASDGDLILGMFSSSATAFLGLSILGLMLVNAQAVTAITGERDGQTLDLLVATDLTAKEFVYGKLGGIFYNTKELALIPVAIVAWLVMQGQVTFEDGFYLGVGYLMLTAFTAMLGLHYGLGISSSRQAIANSMGTIFFLFIGIFILLVLLIETRGSFANQISAFLLFVAVGGFALSQSLTARNPSPALRLAGGLLPVLTFYAITTWLLEGTLGVFLALVAAYGFTTLAMLIPAVSEFDVALGRSTTDKD